MACDKGPELKKFVDVWKTFDEVAPFLRGEEYEEGDADRFRVAINNFTKAFVACWGEEHVTHYIHILYAHGPWMLREHGSLGVWQCQGMEKSHWRARGNYQKHTSHDGGQGGQEARKRKREADTIRGGDDADGLVTVQQAEEIKHSSLYQLMCFDYRMLLHRRRKRNLTAARAVITKEKAVRAKKYREAWQRAFDATEGGEERVRVNCATARKQKDKLLKAKQEFEAQLKEDMHFLHGLVPSD